VVGYSAKDIVTWADLMARSIACAGGRPGDVIHNAYGYGLFTGGLGAHYGAERLGATVVPMSGGSTERQIVLITDFGARVLCATPSYALAIAEVAEKEGVDLRKSKLEIGIFGAEPWSEAMRREVEARLGLKAVDIYGLSEIMGPGVACECVEAQAGLHGWEDHFLFEVIDTDTGKAVKEGEAGFVVEFGRPGIGARFRDIERVTKALAELGVEFESNNPVTSLMSDSTRGLIRPDILNEKILSAIVEIKTKLEEVPAVLRKIRELSREVGTVISIGVSTRCDGVGEEPLREILEREGYPTYRGKTNLGLGRVTHVHD